MTQLGVEVSLDPSGRQKPVPPHISTTPARNMVGGPAWLGLRNGTDLWGEREGRWGACVRAGFLKKGFPSTQMNHPGGKVGDKGS